MPPEPEVSENTMIPSMKVPPKRKGNEYTRSLPPKARPSMKVPPKRKGNGVPAPLPAVDVEPLNESPSEKEGK